MTTMTRDALRSLIGAREDFALKQLEQDPAYLSVCKEQEKTEEMVDELLMRFEKPDRLSIRGTMREKCIKRTTKSKPLTYKDCVIALACGAFLWETRCAYELHF